MHMHKTIGSQITFEKKDFGQLRTRTCNCAGEGNIRVYSCCAVVISFGKLNVFKVCVSYEYMCISPPPQVIDLRTPLILQ